jgi:ABC-type Na+ efflux pump permease subunit
MKTTASIILVLLISALAWMSMGWVAILVLPVAALGALMAFAPVVVEWAECEAQNEAVDSLQNEPATLRTRAACA